MYLFLDYANVNTYVLKQSSEDLVSMFFILIHIVYILTFFSGKSREAWQ